MGATTTTEPARPPLRAAGGIRTASLLGARELRVVLRSPEALVPSLALPLAIYLITAGIFEGYAEQFGFPDVYAFMIPVAILFAVANSSAGQNLVAAIESGYFDKLLATPASRLAILIGAMAADFFRVLAQVLIVVTAALVVAAPPETGLAGLPVLLLLAGTWGLAYGAIGFAVALKTGNAEATQTTFLLFFPLMFLSPLFAPREAMADWMATVVAVNPVTYVVEALRSLTITGWETDALAAGFGATVGLGVVTVTLALLVMRVRVR